MLPPPDTNTIKTVAYLSRMDQLVHEYRYRCTHVAPANNTSIALAFISPESVARKHTIAIDMTMSRLVALLVELQIAAGTNRKDVVKVNSNIRQSLRIKEPECM